MLFAIIHLINEITLDILIPLTKNHFIYKIPTLMYYTLLTGMPASEGAYSLLSKQSHLGVH